MKPFQRSVAHHNHTVLFSLVAFACLNSASLGATPTIRYVQSNYSAPQSSQTTVSIIFTAAQAAGDLNVIVVGWNDTTALVNTVTDKSGNPYTSVIGPTVINGSLSQSIYYAKNIAAAGAGSNTVTVTFSAAAAYPDIRILEYSGADTVNPIDVTAAATGSSTASNSGSAATSNATDLIFAANIVATTTSGPGNGFTGRVVTSPDGDIAEDEMVSASGTYSATAPLGSSGPWIMQMVAFKAAGSISACDLNADGAVNVLDVQLATDMDLGSLPCTVTIGGVSVCTVPFVNTVTSATLGGSCVTPVLSTAPSSINFGNVKSGSTSTQTVTISNTGTGNFTVSNATVTGAGYSISGLSLPLTLGPGQNATFSVTFTPSTAGSFVGNVALTSTALDSLINESLSGAGVNAHTVSLNWTASTSPSVVGYNVYRGTVSGGPYTKLNSVLIAAVSYTDGTVLAGQTYYYVATAVDNNNNESAYSNQAQAVVSVP